MFALTDNQDVFLSNSVSMKTEKKCPSCNEWTNWQRQLNDRCHHCNELLDERAVKEKEEREERERVFRENDFFTIRDTDGFFMIAVRKTGWVLHAIFAAITWFFLWTVTTFSG